MKKATYTKTNVRQITTAGGRVSIVLKNGEQLTIRFPGSPANSRRRANSAAQFLGDAIWSPMADSVFYGRA